MRSRPVEAWRLEPHGLFPNLFSRLSRSAPGGEAAPCFHADRASPPAEASDLAQAALILESIDERDPYRQARVGSGWNACTRIQGANEGRASRKTM